MLLSGTVMACLFRSVAWSVPWCCVVLLAVSTVQDPLSMVHGRTNGVLKMQYRGLDTIP